MREQMVALQLELQKLQAEKDKALDVAAEHDRSTAKGRPYEEAVAEAVDAIARGLGDDCDAVGDLRGLGGRKGDVVVDIDGCSGAPRGRIVFEAKNSRRSRKEALAELEEAMAHAVGRLRRLGRAVRGPAAGARAGAARDRRGQAVRGVRPGGGPRLALRSPTRSPAPGC